MADGDQVRYLGIVADGSTDREIIATLVESVLGACEDLQLGQNLVDYMSAFRRAASTTGKYGLCDQPGRDLRKSIVTVLHAAVSEFQSRISRELRESDLLVLNTDAEWYLREPGHYFREEYPLVVTKIFLAAIEEFYSHASNRHRWKYLPFVLPLVLFPSTDILIAAAKSGNGKGFDFHGMEARRIKTSLYGVDDLRYLPHGDLKRRALDYLTAAAFENIYRHLPESRLFLRTLAWNQVLHGRTS